MSLYEREKALDTWIAEKIGLGQKSPLTRKALEEYQLIKLRETIEWAKKNSRFYEKLLIDIEPEDILELKDIEKLPFTTVEDLREKGLEMLCVSQNEISRIVTLDTSGSTGKPKRIYYTKEDQELTVDYFHHGMKNLVDETDVVLILLPFERPGSVGDLLKSGLERLGAKCVTYGLLKRDCEDAFDVLKLMLEKGVTSIVGAPGQVLALAEASVSLSENTAKNLTMSPAESIYKFHAQSQPNRPYKSPSMQEKTGGSHEEIKELMRTVLLSTEFIPESTVRFIEEAWGIRVFEHYGMTEMGLGGAVSCWVLEGYHPREADLYFEIINPETGETVPEGQYGEVVFTTLTRKAMPFIRYRTGDISRWLSSPCACGSALKRLDKVGDRNVPKNRG
ncbi:MAG: phenylacetate--CoA ligase family protein [Anaerovoracaceae bacterium]